MSKCVYLKAALASLLIVAGSAHARFVSVDPVQANPDNGANFNRYHYANNNPYKFTDPDGRVAIVKRMEDGSIEVNLPTQFKGPAASEDNISAFKSQIEGMSGTYKVDGKDTQVNFKISNITKDTPRAARNTVTLTDGPTDRASGSSAAEVGGNEAWIDVSDRFVSNGTANHEVLHLADNQDRYKIVNGVKIIDPSQGNNIMNVVPGDVDNTNIQEIMQSNDNIFPD